MNKNGNGIMSKEIFNRSISFIQKLTEEQKNPKNQITFHGGEPLLAGKEFYKSALSHLTEIFNCKTNLSIQSNLWLLDDEFSELFKKYHVGIGTSLDGPAHINDIQRSAGYSINTFAGIELLKKQGMSCGCIATFTKQSAEKLEEVFNFFIEKDLHFNVHAAIKPFFQAKDDVFLNPIEFGQMLIRLLELYLKNLNKIQIGTLDTFIKNVANKKSGLCTFTKCLGDYLAIDPKGDLYTCNRFVGNQAFCIGNINKINSFSDITKSAAWQKQQAWQEWIDKECKDCTYKEFCNGGCPYSAFASSNGALQKDPMCEAYKKIYNYIIDKGAAEFFSDEHMIVLNQPQKNVRVQYKSNPLLYIMHDNPHPYDVQQTATKIISAALLGKTSNPKETTKKMLELGLIKSFDQKYSAIERFYNELLRPAQGFGNLYLHITNNCNLSCSHCYSYNGNEVIKTSLSPDIILNMVEEASDLKLRKVIFTGGEPLLCLDFELILRKLQLLKSKRKLPKLVLRTNLSSHPDNSLLEKINLVFDQIIVSIDGSEEIHDKQRGKGAFQKTLNNLSLIDKQILENKTSFSCVISPESLSVCDLEYEKEKMFQLKEQFKINEIRFLPVLPLGRAKQFKTNRIETEKIGVVEWMKRKYYFRTSCGLGQSVMIGSNGDVYPCHVLKETENYFVGNIYQSRLSEIIQQEKFMKLRNITVNTDLKCSSCEMRFLCGGICKIWKAQDCNDLFERAKYLFNDALEICNIFLGKMAN
jgi:uncharacterized protein